MKIEIKNHWTGGVIFATEAESMRDAVLQAIKSRANLSRADLSRADLSRANLSGADLSEAYLSEANLSEANLSEAYLSGAYLSEANLSGADLSGADLSEAYLSEADLSRANLSGADLSEAYLSEANLSGANLSEANLSGANLSEADLSRANLSEANLSEANLSGAIGIPDATSTEPIPDSPWKLPVPVIENLPRKILDAIAQPGCGLEMSSVHTCGTTHCIAGWTTMLGGAEGKALEDRFGWTMAANMIWHKSHKGPRPSFYGSNERARQQLEKCAQREVAQATQE